MKVAFVLIGILAFASNLFAQKKMDLLILKDGTRYKGTVESYKKDDHIIFTFENGISIVHNKDFMPQIEKVFIGGKPDYTSKNGFYGQGKIGLIFNSDQYTNEIFPTGLAINGLLGYQWSQWKRLEMGLGRESYLDINVIPIYIGTQANWFKGNFTPYHFANIGYSIGYQPKIGDGNQRLENVRGGRRMELGVGVKKFGAKSIFVMSIAYLAQNSRLDYFDQPSSYFTKMEMSRVSFSFGFEF